MSLSDALSVGPVADPDAYPAGLSSGFNATPGLPQSTMTGYDQPPMAMVGPPLSPPVPIADQMAEYNASLTGPPSPPPGMLAVPGASEGYANGYSTGTTGSVPASEGTGSAGGDASSNGTASSSGSTYVQPQPLPATPAPSPPASPPAASPQASYAWGDVPAAPPQPQSVPPNNPLPPKMTFAPSKAAPSAAKPDLMKAMGAEVAGVDMSRTATRKLGPSSGEELEADERQAAANDVQVEQRIHPDVAAPKTTRQKLSDRFHQEGEIEQKKGVGEMAVADVNAKGTEKQATNYDKMTDEDLKEELEKKQRDAALMKEAEEQSKKARDFQLDPGRYMANASFFQKALMVIGGAAGGVARGIKGGSNSTLDGINTMIERDIAQQKGQYEQMRQRGIDIHNQWSMNLRKDQNEDAQKAIMKAQVLRATALHVDSQAQKANIRGPMAAAIAQTTNKLGEQADLFDLQGEALANKGAPGPGDIDKRLDAARKEVDHLIDKGVIPPPPNQAAYNRLVHSRVSVGGRYPTGEDEARYQAPTARGNAKVQEQQKAALEAQDLLKQMNDMRSMHPGGVLSPSEQGTFDSLKAQFLVADSTANGKPIRGYSPVVEEKTGGSGATDFFGGRRAALAASQANESSPIEGMTRSTSANAPTSGGAQEAEEKERDTSAEDEKARDSD